MNHPLRRLFAVLPAALTASAPAQQPSAAPPDRYTLIRCGTVLPIPGNDPVKNTTIVVKNGLIDRLSPGFDGPDLSEARQHGAKIDEINLRESFILPGLIDCHVHLTNEWDQTVRARYTTETPEFVALRASVYARKTLDAGFTTVRDLGANEPTTILALRDSINQGLIVGPRILAAGHWIAMTGGHGDFTLGFRQDLIPQPGPEQGIADGPDACMKAVRGQIKLGADCIKLTATGGVLSASTAGLAQHFTQEELNTIVATAHSLGRKAAAHAHGVDGINAALRAGVDSIEHATYLNDESIKLFKEHGAYHVPTLLAAATVGENARKPGFYLPMVAQKALLVEHKAMEGLRRSHAAGVRIAFGTDTGVSPHGQNAREFALMVQAGLTPMETIVAATVTASELLGLSAEVGTLEPGKAADVVAVKGDPLKDVTEFERVAFVMRGGKVYKQTPP